MQDSELKHLMNYYHEDFETLWSGLEEYLIDEPSEDNRRLLVELDAVLTDPALTEAELEALLDAMGSCAYLDETPGGYRGWLEEIARRVRVHLGD